MRLICMWHQRGLARSVVEGRAAPAGAAARHIAGCAECAAWWRDLAGIDSRLRGLEPLHAGGRFVEAVWNRIEAARPEPAPRPLRIRPGLVGIGAVALIAIVLVARQAPRAGKPSVVTPGPVQVAHREPPVETNPPSYRVVPPTAAHGASVQNHRVARASAADARKPVYRRRHPSVHRRVQMAQRPAAAVTPHVGVASKAVVATDWVAVGQWYERNGRAQQAAAAYARAAQQKPDPDVTFAAGRASEASGDVAGALEYYSRALEEDSTSQQGPRKGSMQWSDKSPAAS